MSHYIANKFVFFLILIIFFCGNIISAEEVDVENAEIVIPSSSILATPNLEINNKLYPTRNAWWDYELKLDQIPSVDIEYSPQNVLTLEADYVSYVDENRFVEATGNVLIIYKSYYVTANQTELDLAKDQLKIKHGFVMKRSEQYFEGRFLDYNLATDEGIAREVSLDFGGAFVRGRKVEIRKERIIVYDAEFTRCDGSPPCYKFKSRILTIYPEWNMMVASDAIFYVNRYPVMYLPTYIVERATQIYSDVIPSFGRNRTEGNYVKGKWGYYKNEKVQGHWDLHHLEKLWYRVGFTNRYILDEITAGNVRLHYVGSRGFTGGLNYRRLLGVDSKTSEQRIEDFFLGILPPSAAEYPEVVVDVSSGEILGDQFVSFLPMLTFNSAHYDLGIRPWFWSFSLSAADIHEEVAHDDEDYVLGNINRFRRQRWTTRFFSTYDWMPLGMLRGNVSYDKSGYYYGANFEDFWYRLSSNWNFGRRINWWDYNVGYTHVFDEGGHSPFLFDQFNLSTWDEWGLGTGFWLWDKHRLGYHVDYAIRENRIRNENITFDFRIHHWQVSLVFQTKLRRTYFSVSLL